MKESMLTGREIREKFLQFFEDKGHTVVPSESLVPHEDPTLLFTNAGMNQFKDVFLGLDKRDYRRATSSQKCVRAGGKHNDLDTVGKTARHHTFFEMLGNFSFGDYFKEEAILYAWEFLTQVLGLDKDKLWVTVYKDDDQAEAIWKAKTDVRPQNMTRLGEADNFWSMGDVGPCGPCSEILYDRGEDYACQEETCAIGACDCDRWLELWNLVFMQYDRDQEGTLHPLPRPSIDTGMGLERIASVLQKKDSNYEIDLLRPLIAAVEIKAGQAYDPGPEGFAMRVIADHARSTSFLIADGILPGNEGRGYVLRRILRRAIRFCKVLGIEGPFMYSLVDVVEEIMQEAYPEISQQKDFIKKIIRLEEERFQMTIDAGIRMAQQMVEDIKAEGKDHIDGDQAFTLYDTYGFPFDLTEDIAQENNLRIDEADFEKAMQAQKERARQASGQDQAFKEESQLASLFAQAPFPAFCGYDKTDIKTRVLLLADADKKERKELKKNNRAYLLLEDNPFYAEAGGQVGDKGKLLKDGRLVARVLDSQKSVDGHSYLLVELVEDLKLGDPVLAQISLNERKQVARNHSATHLLHSALKKVVGDHAQQKGSLVRADKLRFDFNHFSPLTQEEIRAIEDEVNQMIMDNQPVLTQEMKLEEAKEIGATALFGEKYGKEVRVVRMADDSLEFCGGTHVQATGQIGPFSILSETGIGSGLRRIEAVSGRAALARFRRMEDQLGALADVYNSSTDLVLEKARETKESLRTKDQLIESLQAKVNAAQSSDLLSQVKEISGLKVMVAQVDATDMDGLRKKGDAIKDKMKDGVLVLGTAKEEKVNFLVMVFGSAKETKVHAGKLIKDIAALAGGGGGGRPDMAQAGGKKPEKLGEALDKSYQLLEKMLA